MLPASSDSGLFHSIAELAEGYRTGSTTPSEVAQRTLKRLHELNPVINAFSQVDEERTLRDAAASDRRWRAGEPLGALDGIPFSVKDTLVAQGFATRRGSLVTSPALAQENAPVVDRVIEAGAVLLGITTTPEFGGGSVTISPLTGISRNAWDPTKTSGGSSGGAAASIAAGIGAFALATDAGGSIRTPAALNGVVGFKATGSIVPTYPANVAGGLSSPGPIARSARDCALVFDAIAVPDIRDADAFRLCRHELSSPIKISQLTFAATAQLGSTRHVDSEILQCFEEACQQLRGLGASLEYVDPGIGDPLPTYKTLLMSGFAYALRDLSEDQRAQVGPQLQDIIEAGKQVTLHEYLNAQQARRDMAITMHRFHERYAFLVTPTVAAPAFDAERWQPQAFEKYKEMRSWVPFAYPFNLTQQPAISVPCGMTTSGLPIGLQIVGPRFSDVVLLQLAMELEAAGLFPIQHPVFS